MPNEKHFETAINQAHGFILGGEPNPIQYTQSACVNPINNNNNINNNSNSSSSSSTRSSGNNNHASSSNSIISDDGDFSSSHPNSKIAFAANTLPYEIKMRARKRACQMKALVVLLAMLFATCIGGVLAYYYMRFNYVNERHLNLTQNMVHERACKRNY
jgi:hypothetical protein